MRTILFVFFLLSLLPKAEAQTNDSLLVKLKNGTVVAIALSDIRVVTFDSVKAGVAESPTNPNRLSYAQNFPNPAVTSTKIEFDTRAPGPVTVNIYDMRANIVRQLHAKTSETGRNALTWDGYNESGMNAPSGIYFYRIILGNEVREGKLIIARH
jgi:hypothetical protein